MIVLPKGAFTVLVDAAEEKTKGGIILDDTTKKKPNSGIIALTCEDLKHLQGKKVVFRENFGEDIKIENTEFKYFRDFDSSIYYVIIE